MANQEYPLAYSWASFWKLCCNTNSCCQPYVCSIRDLVPLMVGSLFWNETLFNAPCNFCCEVMLSLKLISAVPLLVSPDGPVIWRMLTYPPTRRALLVGCGLQMFQQLSGINTVMWVNPSAVILPQETRSVQSEDPVMGIHTKTVL